MRQKHLVHTLLNREQRYLFKAQRDLALENASSDTSSCDEPMKNRKEAFKILAKMPVRSTVEWKLVNGIVTRSGHRDYDKVIRQMNGQMNTSQTSFALSPLKRARTIQHHPTF